MNSTLWEKRIAELHKGPKKIYLVCTGAGAGCQNLLAQVPGASNTILECLFPYSRETLTEFLGQEPESFVSEETALLMAAKAWRKATKIAIARGESVLHVMGVAITGAIATDRIMRGEHRVYIAIRTSEGSQVAHLSFQKNGDGSSILGRVCEGEFADKATIDMILHAAGIEQVGFRNEGIKAGDIEVRSDHVFVQPRSVRPEILTVSPHPQKHILFEGSFNPLHHGHEEIAREVKVRTSKEVVYVITNRHPDKGGIGEVELQKRLLQFHYLAPVLLTDGLQLYVDKARAYPGLAFIVGADVMKKILDPKYGITLSEALQIFVRCGSHFYVADRQGENGIDRLVDLLEEIPEQFHGLFTQLLTQIPMSSTRVRQLMA